MSKTIYLARPIDQASGREAALVLQVRDALVGMGYAVFDPGAAWSLEALQDGMGEALQDVNEQARANAAGVLAVLPDGVPSIGVPIEIAQSWPGTPTVVLGGQAAAASPVLRSLGVSVVTDPTEAAKALDVEIRSTVQVVLEPLVDVTPIGGAEAAAVMGTVPGDSGMPGSMEGGTWRFLCAVAHEVERAANKFPENTRTNGPIEWFGIFIEEAVEVAQAWNDLQREIHQAFLEDRSPDREWEHLQVEVVQAAAMACRLWRSATWRNGEEGHGVGDG